VRGDRKRFQHILVKLISHAVKFTDQRQVVVHAWVESSSAQGWRLRFEVGDAGTTLPVGVHPTLFEPDPPRGGGSVHLVGTRLGLAVTKRLVQLMGGEIGIQSRPDAPSTFWFTVELGQPLDTPLAASRPCALAGRHILVVDDNPSNLRLFGRLASVWKLRVGLVESREAALDYLRHAALTRAPVELVLLDHPSDSADPFALADAMRREDAFPRPAIALLTSRFETLTPAQLSAHGITACEAKPLRPRNLRAMLTRALPAAQRAASAAMPGAA
jgi:CheY-like chemotaxis protein